MARRRFRVSGAAAQVRRLGTGLVAAFVVLVMLSSGAVARPTHSAPSTGALDSSTSAAVGNFSAAIDRLVELVAAGGSGILALVWARVALSWFSNDITKKVQAKDRARDALVGTLLFMAAVTGLFYGLAHWVVTGA